MYTPQHKSVSLATWLAQFETLRSHQRATNQVLTQFVELDLLVGAQAKLPLRLLIEAIPPEAIVQRHHRANQIASKKQVKFSAQHLARLDYQFFLTNLPTTALTPEQISLTYRLRWQIELYFKVWKSGLGLDFLASGRGKKPERILIEVYAKLLGLLLLGNLALASLAQGPVAQSGLPPAAKTNYQLSRSKTNLPASPASEISPTVTLVEQAQNLSEPSLYKLVFVLRRHILGLGQLILSHSAAQPTGYGANYQLPPGSRLEAGGLPSRTAGQSYAELFEQFVGRLLADFQCYGLKEKRRSRPTSFLALHLSTATAYS